MKRKLQIFGVVLLSMMFSLNIMAQDIMITGVFDGPLPNGSPKVLELYVVNDIADLSVYTVKNQTNANTNWTADLNLTGSASANDFIYVVNTGQVADFNAYFGNTIVPIESGVISLNGDDRVGIFDATDALVDIFGEDGVDGTGLAWEWLDGWAYRNVGALASATFVETDWIYSGVDANDNQTDNMSAETPFPIGTFTMEEPTEPVITAPWYTDFSDNLIPEGWGNYDVDGDGYFWETTEIGPGEFGLISETFRMDIYDALTPDNYLTTVKVDISALTNPVMNWKVMAISDVDFAEHYSIYVSTTGNTLADFTEAAVFSETLAEGNVQLDRSISLAGYGDEVYIAFRHHDCTNQFFMAIPELAFQEGEPTEPVITAPWYTDFSDNLIPEGWGNYDVDGDGYFWETTEIGPGEFGLISETFRMDIYDALTPDNYLTTVKVDISALTNPVMNWKVMAISDVDFAEHYSIYVSTTGNTLADFTEAAVFSETLAEGNVQLDRSISLAGYGDEVYVAFRHHDCTNQFFMAIPELAFQEGETTETVTFNVDMNDVEITVFDSSTDILTISGSFTDPAWQEPTLTDLTFSDDDADGIYSLTLPFTTDGNYEYKYYVNAGWNGAEWEGDVNRTFTFAGETLVINDIFGDNPVNIGNLSMNKISAYPNPTSDVFILNLNEQSKVTIINVAGQEVYSNVINGQTTINLSNVEAGVYMINIVNDNYSTQTKIVKR